MEDVFKNGNFKVGDLVRFNVTKELQGIGELIGLNSSFLIDIWIVRILTRDTIFMSLLKQSAITVQGSYLTKLESLDVLSKQELASLGIGIGTEQSHLRELQAAVEKVQATR